MSVCRMSALKRSDQDVRVVNKTLKELKQFKSLYAYKKYLMEDRKEYIQFLRKGVKQGRWSKEKLNEVISWAK